MPNCESRPASAVRPTRIVLAVPLLAGALTLGACTSGGSTSSGSSAPGSTATSTSATASGTASSSATSAGATGGSGAGGTTTGSSESSVPNSSASASSSIANSNPLVYQPVKQKAATKIEKIAARAPGVQSVSYDNEHKTLSLYLEKSITAKQRVVANRVVNQVLHPAGSSTSSKKKHH